MNDCAYGMRSFRGTAFIDRLPNTGFRHGAPRGRAVVTAMSSRVRRRLWVSRLNEPSGGRSRFRGSPVRRRPRAGMIHSPVRYSRRLAGGVSIPRLDNASSSSLDKNVFPISSRRRSISRASLTSRANWSVKVQSKAMNSSNVRRWHKTADAGVGVSGLRKGGDVAAKPSVVP
jgi:hypothetical protein